MTKYILSLLLTGLLWITSCVEETNPEFDQRSFTKIYDNYLFTSDFLPIDMVQTTDGGYLILGGRRLSNSNFTGIYLMKVDKKGNFIKEVEVDESYVNPIAQLALISGSYYFFCMDPLTLQAQLVQLDSDLENINVTTTSGDLYYPSAMQPDGNNLVLLTYNHLTKQSIIAVVNTSGTSTQQKGFTIGAGDQVEEPIINHFIRTGRQYPFEAGRIPSGLYYFNGFYNYTFSLVFTDLNQDNPNGVVQGIQDDGGLSAVLPLTSAKFAAARFNFGDNFILPNTTLNTTGISSSVDLGGNTFPELERNANMRILRTQIKGKNVLVYGSNTKSKQIGLYFYDEANGTFLTSKYLGFSNPFEIAQVISTEDGGLAVCGTTYLAGRFPRICIIKIASEDIKGL
ncbi:MAG: hypothetical protein KF687_09790 [Cyclobacteriaceae bacterium]|nr:hypothetical protein [Cyclobacteriaceae bacterium]